LSKNHRIAIIVYWLIQYKPITKLQDTNKLQLIIIEQNG